MAFSSYLDTPNFLVTALHVIVGLELPFHFFAAYCILFKTPKSMKSARWGMLNMHVWSMGLDLAVGLLTIPYILYPALAGFALGVLSKFGVPMSFQAYLLSVLIGLSGVSIVAILENRYFLLFARDQLWRHYRIPFLLFNYLIVFLYFIPSIYLIPQQNTARSDVFQLPQEIYNDYNSTLFVLATNFSYVVLPVVFMINVLVLESAVFTVLIYGNMSEQTKNLSLSRFTIKVQRKFLRALNIQTCLPLIILFLPFGYLVVSRISNTYIQSANNLCFITISAHGLSSSLIMLYIHTPYREVFSQIFCSKIRISARWALLTDLQHIQ